MIYIWEKTMWKYINSTVNLRILNSSNKDFLNKVLLVSYELEEVHHRQINVAQMENFKLYQHEHGHENRPSFQKDPDEFSTIPGF